MELDCTIWSWNIEFDHINIKNEDYPIVCRDKWPDGKYNIRTFTKYGYYSISDSKCVIFPKGKTTWEGFVPPCKFKEGDVLVDKDNNIGIFQKFEGIYWYSYIYLGCDGELRGFSIGGSHKQTDVHPATKEQRDLLFQKIKEAGYCWNDKTKTLEKLIIPQFKVGNRIKEKQTGICGEIISVQKNRYNVKIDDKGLYVYFREQDNWELLPDKFDIATLKPFDRVLVRDNINEKWNIHFFSYIDDAKMFKTIMGTYIQCIPYEGNEHLLGKVEDCKNFN